jgi:hypothetical protein
MTFWPMGVASHLHFGQGVAPKAGLGVVQGPNPNLFFFLFSFFGPTGVGSAGWSGDCHGP